MCSGFRFFAIHVELISALLLTGFIVWHAQSVMVDIALNAVKIRFNASRATV